MKENLNEVDVLVLYNIIKDKYGYLHNLKKKLKELAEEKDSAKTLKP